MRTGLDHLPAIQQDELHRIREVLLSEFARAIASATLLPRDAVKRMVNEGKNSAQIAGFYGTSPELVVSVVRTFGADRGVA